MFNKQFIADAVNRSAETDVDRRKLLTMTGLAGAGVAGAVLAGGTAASAAPAVNDGTILNFALNLEYLEAEFYHHAVYGTSLAEKYTTGKGRRGGVIGGRKVNFKSKRIREYAREIANDELNHVRFLRAGLKSAAVARPTIDISKAFAAAAQAAGLGKGFDPYANDTAFLLGAFVFEDVGVTAYKGASPFISNKTYLEAAAGILAVEAYHAATIRSSLFEIGGDAIKAANAISDARDSLDGKVDDDQHLLMAKKFGGGANIVPTNSFSIAYSRSPQQTLNVVYLNPGSVSKGGFFPHGVNSTDGLFVKSGSNS